MPNAKVLRGIELRYVLTTNLAVHGRATIPDMIELLEYQRFTVAGYAPKVVSDALRWELRRGRARRLRRGLYGPGVMPRSTEQYIHQRVIGLRAEADVIAGRNDDAFWESLPA
jgi:hypothetical protein